MASDPRALRPATCSVEAAAALLGIGRSSAYQAARFSGEIAGVPVLRIGRRLVVPIRPLAERLGLAEDEILRRLEGGDA